MVRGRRVKTVTKTSPIKRKKQPLKQSKKLKDTLITETCIRDFFSIDCFGETEVDCKARTYKTKIKCSDIKVEPKYDSDKCLTPIKDEFLELNSVKDFKIISPSTPHRIELRSENKTNNLSKNMEGTDVTRNGNLKTKIKTKLGKADHKLTEYFPIRRSERKTKKTVLEEKQKNLELLLRDGIEDDLEVHTFKDKGRGVVARRPFSRGDFVVEYSGELLDVAQAKKREEMYAQDATTGCYMYYFKYQNQQYCVDATAESGRLGRLVNHARYGNLITRTVEVDGLPRLVLIAKDNIRVGDEICYDYGDRSKESLKNHPWLAL